MQNRATFKTVTRNGANLLVLAAVAAAGLSVGRWVVPETDGGSSAPAAAGVQRATVTSVMDPLTLDGPAADLAALNGITVDPPLATAPVDPYTLDGPAADLAALQWLATVDPGCLHQGICGY